MSFHIMSCPGMSDHVKAHQKLIFSVSLLDLGDLDQDNMNGNRGALWHAKKAFELLMANDQETIDDDLNLEVTTCLSVCLLICDP